MLLAVDSGNARIKWALADGERIVTRASVGRDQAGTLASAWRGLPPLTRIVGCNVAGEAARLAIEAAASDRGRRVEWLRSEPARAGVINRYHEPAQLGADRWAALIAARRLFPGSACVVVDAGTAITADALTAGGEFRGGVIVPGLALMRRALAEHTAQLDGPAGRHDEFPRATADAIATGALLAAAGAVEGMARALIACGEGAPRIVLGGGDAPSLAQRIERPLERIDDLVIRGLIVVARDDAPHSGDVR